MVVYSINPNQSYHRKSFLFEERSLVEREKSLENSKEGLI